MSFKTVYRAGNMGHPVGFYAYFSWLRSIEPGTVVLDISNRRTTLKEGKMSQVIITSAPGSDGFIHRCVAN